MKTETEKLVAAAIAVVGKSEGALKDHSEAVLQQIEGYLGGRLPADLIAILEGYGVTVSESTKLSTLLTRVKKLVFDDLRVKRFKDGYSVLKDSPLDNILNEEETMKTATNKTSAKTNVRARKSGGRKPVAKKTTARKAPAKKAAAKKAPAKKAPAKTGLGTRAKGYKLTITKSALNKLEGFPTQAVGILRALGDCGGKADRADLLAAMPKHVTSNQTMNAILAFYQKKLVEAGHMEKTS